MNSQSNILHYIVTGFCAVYFLLFILPLISSGFDAGMLQGGRTELLTVLLAFLIFLAGTIYSWFNERIGGLIICVWHFLVWAFSLLLWADAGMILILVFPMLIPATFLIHNWYIQHNEIYADKSRRWSLNLRILLLNYAAIYLLVVFSHMAPILFNWELNTRVDELAVWSYTSVLGLSLLFSFLLFIIGVILTWKSELIAGIIFIIWYGIIIYLGIQHIDFARSGPWNLFGVTILVHGILYIVNDRRKRFSK